MKKEKVDKMTKEELADWLIFHVSTSLYFIKHRKEFGAETPMWRYIHDKGTREDKRLINKAVKILSNKPIFVFCDLESEGDAVLEYNLPKAIRGTRKLLKEYLRS